VPAHVAWVAARRDPSGHPESSEDAEDQALLALVDAAADLGVQWLTVQEPSVGRSLFRHAEDLDAKRILVLGSEEATGERSTTAVGKFGADAGRQPETSAAPMLRVLVAQPHSGKESLVDAVRRLADGGMTPKKVDEEAIGAMLGVPDVDLLVVTGGDPTVPDLLTWQVAYSEIVFLPDPWPHVGRPQLLKAVDEYRRRDRRYGGLVASGKG